MGIFRFFKREENQVVIEEVKVQESWMVSWNIVEGPKAYIQDRYGKRVAIFFNNEKDARNLELSLNDAIKIIGDKWEGRDIKVEQIKMKGLE